MATGNIGRRGVGVNPLRGQNNVQGSCDMGSFPHELPGYRHVSDDTVRHLFEGAWGTSLRAEPGLRIPNMLDAATIGTFRAIYIQGEDLAQSDPNTTHVKAALGAMDLVVVQDLFLNETAAFAHVFLPGTSFLEKDGTFTNAERRINRVRPIMASRDRQVGVGGRLRPGDRDGLSDALRRGRPDHGRDRRADADVRGRLLRPARPRRQRAVALQRGRTLRHADHARGPLRPRARATSSPRPTSPPTSARRASTRSCSPPGAS